MTKSVYLSIGTRSVRDTIKSLSGMVDLEESEKTDVGLIVLREALQEYEKFIGIYEWDSDNHLTPLNKRKEKKVLDNMLDEPIFFGRLAFPGTYNEFDKMAWPRDIDHIPQALVEIDSKDKEYSLNGKIIHNEGLIHDFYDIKHVEWKFKNGAYVLQDADCPSDTPHKGRVKI